MTTTTAFRSTEEPPALGKRQRATDVVAEALDILVGDGYQIGFKAVHRMMRRMWADEARVERNRVLNELRIIEQEGGLRTGHERIASDPVGELAADLADYIKVRWTA